MRLIRPALVILFCALVLASPRAKAEEAPATRSSNPATTQPSDENYRAHPAWNQDCEKRVADIKGKPCDVIFIGDSITQNFVGEPTPKWKLLGKTVWDKYYANRNALDFGVGADKTQDVLWRLAHMDVQSLRPKVAVILIGINNYKDTAADIAAGVEAVVTMTRQTFPGARVILVSVLPSNRGIAKYEDVNKTLEAFCDGTSVFYLDVFSRMTPTGASFKGIGGDHVHLTPEGYEIWASTMEPLMTRLLALGQ